MGRDRTEPTTPDLSSTAPFGQTSSAAENEGTSAQEGRHVLPKNLPDAIKHLNDEELDRLVAVALAEAKRRGRSPPNVQAYDFLPRRSSQTGRPSPGRQVEAATVSLTRGQINAVRAAFKAGIKPSMIARQFGISQSDVRKALATDASGRRITD
jgi:hypothetical protein